MLIPNVTVSAQILMYTEKSGMAANTYTYVLPTRFFGLIISLTLVLWIKFQID